MRKWYILYLDRGHQEHIHLFVSRNKVFDKENVLQETIIIKVRKTYITPAQIMISSSNSNRDFNKVTSLIVPYNLVVSSED